MSAARTANTATKVSVMSEPTPAPRSATKLNKKLFVIHTTPVDSPPAGDRDEIRAKHLQYQYELEDRGIMFAAGPFLGADDKPTGAGLIIYRADSLEAAKRIADADPYHASGFRSYTIQPWRISEGTFTLKVEYSTGRYMFD
jgi:uncharacterized protein YciI